MPLCYAEGGRQDLESRFTVSKFTVSKFTVSRFTVSKFTVSKFTVSMFTVSKFTVSRFTVSKFTVSKFTVSRFTVSKFTFSHPDVFIYTYKVKRISQTHDRFLHENAILGRHVSTLSESSSSPLKYRSKVNNF